MQSDDIMHPLACPFFAGVYLMYNDCLSLNTSGFSQHSLSILGTYTMMTSTSRSEYDFSFPLRNPTYTAPCEWPDLPSAYLIWTL